MNKKNLIYIAIFFILLKPCDNRAQLTNGPVTINNNQRRMLTNQPLHNGPIPITHNQKVTNNKNGNNNKAKEEFAEAVTEAYVSTERMTFDIPAKRTSVTALLEKAQEYFEKNGLVEACRKFAHTSEFVHGDVFISVMDMNGRYLVHPEKKYIWKNFSNIKDTFGASIAPELIKKAQTGGGWVAYEWRDATKVSYVRMAKNNGVDYVLEASYYPHSKEDAVIALVKGAVAVVNKDIQDGRPVEQAFSTISYRMGRFVVGDLYLYAVRFDGVLFAQGDEPTLIGENVLERTDIEGRPSNKIIIERLQKVSPGEGVWIDYVSKRAPKKAYAEKIIDKNGVQYFIAAGYYPDADRTKAVDLVHRGYQYMKSHGLSQAVKDFSAAGSDFIYGDLMLFIYDLKGMVMSPESKKGHDISKLKDEDGRFVFQSLLEMANKGGGWVDFKVNKSFQTVYVEKVDLGVDSYLIGTSLYPVSKKETMMLLVKSGANYLETHTLAETCDVFSQEKSSFIRGDLSIFIFDLKGTCYVYGDRMDLVWKNLLDAKDDNNKAYVKLLINTGKSGAGQITYHKYGRPVIVHVEPVIKNDVTYIVGSQFYQ